MLDCTDRHLRYLLRLLTRRAFLYTEMVVADALLHGDTERFLAHHPDEHPLALQIGGSDPRKLARSAALAEQAGYDEININVGCPSDHVQAGAFGACLMAEPQTVADCVAAMRARAAIPVTMKTRIGIDSDRTPERLHRLVELVAAAGCSTVIVHARNAWLHGLSPKQNRSVPPLRYDVVYALKQAHPGLEVIINGGIVDYDAMHTHLERCDGVMLGRLAYGDPFSLARADGELFGDTRPVKPRDEVLAEYLEYVAAQVRAGVPVSLFARHLSGWFSGQPGARRWRRFLSENAYRWRGGADLFESALAAMSGAGTAA